ncbi:MAG: hypothetical protein WBB02_10315, partial [Saprospiraceae bacterium]
MSADPSGFIITASKVETGIANQWRKVQVTKIDTLGNLIWQKIIGKEPITTYDNVPYSSYIDVNGFIYIGIGYSDIAYTGIKHDYES